MGNQATLLYGYETIAEISSGQVLADTLTSLRGSFRVSRPAFDLVYSEDIHLIIGLSEDWCWLHYLNERTGYYLPKNDANSEGTTYFMFGGHHTEVLQRNCVDFETVLLVVHAFLQNGELPAEVIEWEELR